MDHGATSPLTPALDFHTSSRCSDGCGGCCVEVAQTPTGVTLRDTEGRTVEYTDQEWADFLVGVRRGEFHIMRDTVTG
ncbi:DUF397 domain-containing protein [Actinomadura alba]|uniref:DUF397 domain-containing protein n=1 Tax=Actinomadura alba TaxID=406431 RepID=A0ABR7LMP6_9ACTN|nr:DUF397 domain-containing protein [Actinomadura alba]MBC6466117.1 DUF397 domain-containing protein [Actinomadura alba]